MQVNKSIVNVTNRNAEFIGHLKKSKKRGKESIKYKLTKVIMLK